MFIYRFYIIKLLMFVSIIYGCVQIYDFFWLPSPSLAILSQNQKPLWNAAVRNKMIHELERNDVHLEISLTKAARFYELRIRCRHPDEQECVRVLEYLFRQNLGTLNRYHMFYIDDEMVLDAVYHLWPHHVQLA